MRLTFWRHPLLRLAWRQSWRRPLQSIFLVVGVAIGVAMIVAIDLANGSANRAFALGTEQITGRATHQVVGGPDGVEAARLRSSASRVGLSPQRSGRRELCQRAAA